MRGKKEKTHRDLKRIFSYRRQRLEEEETIIMSHFFPLFPFLFIPFYNHNHFAIIRPHMTMRAQTPFVGNLIVNYFFM